MWGTQRFGYAAGVRFLVNFAVPALLAALLPACAAGQTAGEVSGPWVMEQSGTTAGLRGIHAVSAEVAWASGTGGTILRTVDGGTTWTRCAVPPGAEKLDFRGIWAWDAQTAIAMSSGPGDASRLYKTVDGCASWKLVVTNPDKDGFWDAMAALGKVPQILGDPVGGAFVVAHVGFYDGSPRLWGYSVPAKAKRGAGAFAASNSSLVVQGSTSVPRRAWFGAGGKPGAFVYRMDERLIKGSWDVTEYFWRAVPVPIAGGNDSSGVFSLGFRDADHGIAAGGDYTKPNDSAGTAAWSADGGKTWHAAAKTPHGYRSAVAWDEGLKAWIAAGTNGSDISYDDGKTWLPLDNGNWNALSLPWVVGPDGRIGKLEAEKLKK